MDVIATSADFGPAFLVVYSRISADGLQVQFELGSELPVSHGRDKLSTPFYEGIENPPN